MKDRIFKIIIFILLLIQYSSLKAQSDQQFMHDKYWFYKHRLKTEFMMSGLADCGTAAGFCIPASAAYMGDKYNGSVKPDIKFGDGTSFLGNYIGVLATELKLMLDSGASQDQLDRVREELFQAMRAYERVDFNAEVLFNPKAGHCGDPANGFFCRDDVGYTSFKNNFPTAIGPDGTLKSMTSDYEDAKDWFDCANTSDDKYRYPSVDQISNLLVGFALVVKSCYGQSYNKNGFNYDFVHMAQEYTDKILKYLTDNNYYIPIPYAHNNGQCYALHGGPNTQESTNLAFALAAAGNKIRGGNFGGDPVVCFGQCFPSYNPYNSASTVQGSNGIWQNFFNYPSGQQYVLNNYNEQGNNHQNNNAVFMQLAAVGNSWRAGLTSEKTSFTIIEGGPDIWLCTGTHLECDLEDYFHNCIHWKIVSDCGWQKPDLTFDIYCYNNNLGNQLGGYITDFLFGASSRADLMSLLPAYCVPLVPLPEFSVNTTSTALSNYGALMGGEYFPLLHHYLHDCGPYSYDAGSLYDKLLSAPCTGPHYKPYRDINNPTATLSNGSQNWDVASTSEGKYGWHVENRWEKSNPDKNALQNGGWNGIDYMIAYNIFHIMRGGTDGFPAYTDELNREIRNNYYPIIQSSTQSIGSTNFPKTELGFETILANNLTVNANQDPVKNGHVTLHAGKSIKITNLTVKPGAYFKAYTDPFFGCIDQGRGVTRKYFRTQSDPAENAKQDENLLKQSFIKQSNGNNDAVKQALTAYQQQTQYTPISNYVANRRSEIPESDVVLYPNPADNNLQLSFSANGPQSLKIQIFDLAGKLWEQKNITDALGAEVNVDISTLEPGMYTCKISSDSYAKNLQFVKR